MSVAISESLSAAAASSARRPSVLVTATSHAFGFPRFEWQRAWQDDEADDPHAAAIASDGSLIRIRNVSGALYFQRIADPSDHTSLWQDEPFTETAWNAFFATTTSGRGVAVAAHPTNAEVTIVYPRGNSLYHRTSGDNGVSFGAETTIVTEASGPNWPALAYRVSTGNVCLFYALGAAVKRLRRTSGTWAASGTSWTNTVASLTGIAACHDTADFALLITGTENSTTHKRVWSAIMGDAGFPANAWSAPVTVAESDVDSTLTYHAPSILRVPSIRFYGTFAARESGDVAVDRTWWTHTAYGGAATSTWLEPAPHEHRSAFGLALALDPGGDEALAASAHAVYRCELGEELADLGDALVSADVRFAPTSTAATLVFDDRSGDLADLAQFADNRNPAGFLGAALAPGHQLTLAPGYVTSAGFEDGVAWRLHIDALKTSFTRDGHRRFTVRCSGPWEAAGRWHAPQASQVASGTLSRGSLFARVCGRAGVPAAEMAIPDATSAAWEDHEPSFAQIAGESGRATLARLLRPVADVALPDSSNGGFRLTSWEDPRWEPLVGRLKPRYWWKLHEASGSRAATEEVEGKALWPVGFSAAGEPKFGISGPLQDQFTRSAQALSGESDGSIFTDHGTRSWYNSATQWSFLALVYVIGYPSAGSGAHAVVMNNGRGTAASEGYGMVLLPSGNLAYSAEGVALVDFGDQVPLNAWTMLALTRDNSTVRAYIDATLVGTSATAPNAPSSSGFFLGGKFNDGAGAYQRFFTGRLSQCAFFDRALTTEELDQLQRARDPAAWAFGPAGHPLLTAEAGVETPAVNWSRVSDGEGRYADAFVAANVYRDGPRRGTLRVLDADTDLKVEAYAAGSLERDGESDGGDCVVPWHPGLQLGDIVRLDEGTPRASLFRIEQLTLKFERTKRYDASLGLGVL